ncbi:D-cysteine desulfhydrase family protein [Biformimicrobium ophioploci]|uniref:Aminocyclopropane-1-carboxylate deaminase/D-cysteine desulfhydrase family protein n=1 Tax=Biformimicrobium ophioploci TaxID=3036711 RepID=A0ABQ6M1P6_9GAMM|nr:D-cysteine desulfhydrase family protein [Microbulbifer sp. NKW57]GMG88275.1 aminocyclopropane-1-carboxylate deaminase/D-cysteine desulfhydrase family protein [Microbulbifer sp. NKW57]
MPLNIPFPKRTAIAQLPTPLQPLDRITEKYCRDPDTGPRIWIKRDDLTEMALSGNKIRKLEFVVAAAQASGCDTLITCGGLQSNHCRATALLGARLGLKVHLVLRGEPGPVADGNLLLDHVAGAEVSTYPPGKYIAELPQLLEQWKTFYGERGSKAFVIPTGASDGYGIWGYLNAVEELERDFAAAGIAPQHIVCATGSGGTQAGLTLGFHLAGSDTQVTGYAVCDDEQYFLDKVAEDVEHWQSLYSVSADLCGMQVNVNADYIGPGYGVAGEDVFSTIRELAALEGIVLDPVYTGKAFHGLLRDIELGRYEGCRDLVFIHTGGLFGLFPQREQMVRQCVN